MDSPGFGRGFSLLRKVRIKVSTGNANPMLGSAEIEEVIVPTPTSAPSGKISLSQHAYLKPSRNHRIFPVPGHRPGRTGGRAECRVDHPQLARGRAAVLWDYLFRSDYRGHGGEYHLPCARAASE